MKRKILILVLVLIVIGLINHYLPIYMPLPHRLFFYAHRGYSAEYPENTMIAFKEAINAGFDSIECDVQVTRDGIPIIMHDLSVDKTTNGKGNVCDLTIKQIKALDAGSWFSINFAGERVPTLAEVIKFCRKNKITPLFHIKSYTEKDLKIIAETVNIPCIMAGTYQNYLVIKACNNSIDFALKTDDPTVLHKAFTYLPQPGINKILCEHSIIPDDLPQQLEFIPWGIRKKNRVEVLFLYWKGITRMITSSLHK